MFKLYNHLGFHNPYFIETESGIELFTSFEEALEYKKGDKILDFTALVQILSTGFCFGNRTLVKGIYKSPWMAKLNESKTDWEYYNLPNHKENQYDLITIAKTFITLLEEELISYTSNYNNIGILLTGGMDSRIVAAILYKLIKEEKLTNKNVYAYTWGKENSRDVVYAKRISELYNFTWKHLVVDENQMKINCDIAIKNGCEYTPLHLHAMSKINDEKYLDCVLAGSFGDSVGRAEFSGVHVKNISNLRNSLKNTGSFLRNDYLHLVEEDTIHDLKLYHDLFPQEKDYQLFEQDQQIHYMRKMLNACMSIIDKDIPLYQMFSSPKVFGYMWSLSPELRNDLVYKEILMLIAPELLEIPWARTGLIYPNKKGDPDKYLKNHHDYGAMIRTDFKAYIDDSINNNLELANKIFNVNNLNVYLKLINYFPIEGKYFYEEKLLYIAQILNFISLNDLSINLDKSIDKFNLKEMTNYIGRYLLNKFN